MSWKKFMVGVLMLAGAPVASAWTAVAHSPQDGVSFLYYMAKSAAEAEQQALAGCERAATGCVLLGRSQDGPLATVVVRGRAAYTRAGHSDPERAEQQALQECRQRDSDCRLVAAAWDRGTHIMAVAIDHENAWVGPTLPGEAQAREQALLSCRAASRSPDKCSLFHVLNGPGWVAIARGALTTGVGISVRSADIARRNATQECEAGGAEPGYCTNVRVFHNPAGAREPASFRQMVTRIRADSRATTASVPPFLGRPDH